MGKVMKGPHCGVEVGEKVFEFDGEGDEGASLWGRVRLEGGPS